MTALRIRMRPQQATLLMSVCLAAVALTVTAQSGASNPIVGLDLPTSAVVLTLAGLFFLAEQMMLNVEFRHQAHSFTLAGVPLAIAVLVAPEQSLMWIRVAGAAVALVAQRTGLYKIAFNLAAYAFEITLAGASAHALAGHDGHLNVQTLAVFTCVIVVIDQGMSALVLVVIRIHSCPLSRADVKAVLQPAFALAVITSALACSATMLISLGGPTGAVLVVAISLVSAAAYRSYAETTRRHHGLELVHEFVADGVGAASVSAVANHLLVRVRAVLRAGAAELMAFDPDDRDLARWMRVGEDGVLEQGRRRLPEGDWVYENARRVSTPMLLARNSKDVAVRRWLTDNGVRDAVAIPMTTEAGAGILLVTNRLGEIATFTSDDVSLLETLTGHLGVALHSAWLVEELSYDASHDSLTGLHNRAYLTTQLEALGDRSDAAVMLLDLNGFKEVNDTLGHDAGDRLLISVARRLKALMTEAATVARLGGDEFAVLLPDAGSDPEAVLEFAHSIADAVAEPVQLAEARLTARASIGVSMAATGGQDLLRQADTAMYAAKTGQLSAALFDPEMDRERLERLALLTDLRTSLEEHPEEFVVYYQPKNSLADGSSVSAEALVRWQHPVRGLVGPDVFIPMAESTGLIEVLTPLVLDAALAECADWRAAGHQASVAVNLSARNIEDPALPARVAAALARWHVPAASLILEITESSVMGDPAQTVPILHTLRGLGVALSLDDFGTGYSSLSYLQRLPVSEVKIDRSFVVGLSGPDAANSRALIASIAGLGANLGLCVVAEGIEDGDRLLELEQLGVDIAQGYHISRPLPPGAICDWFATHQQSLRPVLRLLA